MWAELVCNLMATSSNAEFSYQYILLQTRIPQESNQQEPSKTTITIINNHTLSVFYKHQEHKSLCLPEPEFHPAEVSSYVPTN